MRKSLYSRQSLGCQPILAQDSRNIKRAEPIDEQCRCRQLCLLLSAHKTIKQSAPGVLNGVHDTCLEFIVAHPNTHLVSLCSMHTHNTLAFPKLALSRFKILVE